jgi:hypothetical protein
METQKSRILNVHVCKDSVEPEKLYYEKQKDDTDVYSRNEEAVARKRSNLNESEEEQLGQLFTVNAGEQKQNSAPELEEEMDYPQQRNDINKLKEKADSTLLGDRSRY